MTATDALYGLETPALLVDRPRLARSIARVQEIARRHGLAVRPHIKTHKCVELAKLQLEAGACGVTASKTTEALIFVEAGVPSLTVAYPVIAAEKATRLAEAAAVHGCELRFIADSEAVVEALAAAAQAGGHPLGVFVKIDVGLGRVGLKPEAPELLPLARRIAETPGLELRGLLSHAGHAYGAADPAGVRAVAESERQQMLAARDRLTEAGLPAPEISVGSTPTVLACENFEGLSEIRPGNYVFYDLTAVRLGAARLDEVSLSVLVSVVSVSETYAIVDAGSKVLSSDLGPHGAGGKGYGRAFRAEEEIGEAAEPSSLAVEKLSEEHGFVRLNGAKLRVGDRLRVVPNHSCPVANLARRLHVLDADGALQDWPVAAAGRVL